ncbi:MAG TPA: protein kinase [Pirellulales bacterium]|nr:protein kinase [Pirellulales bacterium]
MSDCPSEPDLLAFHLGTLDDEQVEQVAAHLETCTVCEAAVQRLDTRVDPLLAALRESPLSSDLLRFSVGSQEPGRHAPDEAGSAWPEWPDLPGYEILGVLGRGGMGIVYKGRQASVNRLVALKCLRTGSKKEAIRARAEAEALGRLQHPYIVQIHEVIEHQGRVYLALEFVAGGSLSSKLTGKPQPCEAAAELIELVARAVHHAHVNGIVHRDLKPANVLLACGAQESELRAANHGVRSTAYGLPKIADFGLAKWLAEDSGHTEHGDVLGTANYMAPEQAAGHVDLIGPATDIYSLGVVLYELLTGRVPLQGTTTLETLALVRSEEPVSPRRLQPQIPRDLETICLKCLGKEPSGRYASAAALADDLHNFLHHVPIRARPITFWERGWKWAKRRPAVAALSLALTLVALVGVAAVAWLWQQAEQTAEREFLARRAAESNQRQVERLSVSMMLDRAAMLCESGEVARGLVWLGQALETSQRIGEPDLERVARLNVTGWRPFLVRKRAEGSLGTGVVTAAFAPSGGSLVTAGSDGRARFWDVATGQVVGQPLTLSGPICSLAYNPQGKRLLAGSSESELHAGETGLWDAASGKPMHPALMHAGPVTVVAFAQQGETFVAVSPQEARLWRTVDGKPVGSPMTHGPVFQGEATGGKPYPMTAVVSPDGRLIATGGCDKMVRLWSSANAEPIGEPLVATHPVVVLAFSPDSKTLLAGSLDGGVRMWDVATGQRRGESLRLRGNVRVVAFSPDGQIAAAAGAVGYEDREPSGEVQLCQVETGQNLGGALAHPRPVRALAFSPEGRLLLTGCEDGQARLFVTATGAPIGKPLPHDAPVNVVAFGPDGRTALTATARSNRACLKFWNAPHEQAFGRPLVQPGELAGVGFSDDGATLTTTSGDGSVRRWQLDTGRSQEVPIGQAKLVAPPIDPESNIEPIAVSPDGLSMLVATSDGVARLRDAVTGKVLGPPISRDGVRAVAYSGTPPRLAAAGSDGKIVVWDSWLPLKGSAERVKLSIELLTGLELVLHETIRPLSEDRRRDCRRRLDELGGPLLDDDP